MNHITQYGKPVEYIKGSNDFPVTPSHSCPLIGASLGYFLTRQLGLEIDGRYNLSAGITLQDPSDGDTVKITSYSNYSVTANIIYKYALGRLGLYFDIGGGLNKLFAKNQTYVSQNGYDVELSTPKKTMDPVLQAGVGAMFSFSKAFGIRLDARYMKIFNDSHSVNGINAAAGIFLCL